MLPGASSALRLVKLPPEGCRAEATLTLALPPATAGGRAPAALGLEPGCCFVALGGSRQPVKGHSRQLLLTELCAEWAAAQGEWVGGIRA